MGKGFNPLDYLLGGDDFVASEAEWVPYSGPQGGSGWINPETGNIVYDDEPPGDIELPDDPEVIAGIEDQEKLTAIAESQESQIVNAAQRITNLDEDEPDYWEKENEISDRIEQSRNVHERVVDQMRRIALRAETSGDVERLVEFQESEHEKLRSLQEEIHDLEEQYRQQEDVEILEARSVVKDEYRELERFLPNVEGISHAAESSIAEGEFTYGNSEELNEELHEVNREHSRYMAERQQFEQMLRQARTEHKENLDERDITGQEKWDAMDDWRDDASEWTDEHVKPLREREEELNERKAELQQELDELKEEFFVEELKGGDVMSVDDEGVTGASPDTRTPDSIEESYREDEVTPLDEAWAEWFSEPGSGTKEELLTELGRDVAQEHVALQMEEAGIEPGDEVRVFRGGDLNQGQADSWTTDLREAEKFARYDGLGSIDTEDNMAHGLAMMAQGAEEDDLEELAEEIHVAEVPAGRILGYDSREEEIVLSDGRADWVDYYGSDVSSEAMVSTEAPEGIPDEAEYVPPDEEPPEGAQTFESDRGATYYLPAGETGDGDAGVDAGEADPDDTFREGGHIVEPIDEEGVGDLETSGLNSEGDLVMAGGEAYEVQMLDEGPLGKTRVVVEYEGAQFALAPEELAGVVVGETPDVGEYEVEPGSLGEEMASALEEGEWEDVSARDVYRGVGSVEDPDLLADALEAELRGRNAKTSRERLEQRLRAVGGEPGDVRDRVFGDEPAGGYPPDAPYDSPGEELEALAEDGPVELNHQIGNPPNEFHDVDAYRRLADHADTGELEEFVDEWLDDPDVWVPIQFGLSDGWYNVRSGDKTAETAPPYGVTLDDDKAMEVFGQALGMDPETISEDPAEVAAQTINQDVSPQELEDAVGETVDARGDIANADDATQAAAAIAAQREDSDIEIRELTEISRDDTVVGEPEAERAIGEFEDTMDRVSDEYATAALVDNESLRFDDAGMYAGWYDNSEIVYEKSVGAGTMTHEWGHQIQYAAGFAGDSGRSNRGDAARGWEFDIQSNREASEDVQEFADALQEEAERYRDRYDDAMGPEYHTTQCRGYQKDNGNEFFAVTFANWVNDRETLEQRHPEMTDLYDREFGDGVETEAVSSRDQLEEGDRVYVDLGDVEGHQGREEWTNAEYYVPQQNEDHVGLTTLHESVELAPEHFEEAEFERRVN